MSPFTLLDTDTLSEFLKGRNPAVARHAAHYLNTVGPYAISEMSRFEVKRGLLWKNNRKQLLAFEQFCSNSIVYPIVGQVVDLASDLWVFARRAGFPHNDADLLIAATALAHSRTIVTGNTSHFNWLPGLTVVDWRTP